MTNQPASTAYFQRTQNPSLQQQQVRQTQTFAANPWRIILYIGKTETVTSMGLEVSTPLTVGRADLVEGYIPGVDLGPFGGQDAGVSRRHAVLWGTQDALYIRDLGSTNGTHINGFKLQPKLTYKLRNGDRIEVGQMQCTLRIVLPAT
jgi:pSer/pThr/pTyr-binding forkhead associated (FHA) protein